LGANKAAKLQASRQHPRLFPPALTSVRVDYAPWGGKSRNDAYPNVIWDLNVVERNENIMCIIKSSN